MINRAFSRRTHTIGALLLVTLLTLAGCGGNAGEATPEVAPTSTLIPTLAPATATPMPAQPTATEAVATATPEAVEPVATEPEPEATAEVTASAPVTETGTAEAAPSEEITATEPMTTSDEITAAEGVSATEEVTAAQEMTEDHAMHESSPITPSTEITSSAEISGFEAARDLHLSFLQPTNNAIVPLTFTVAISSAGIPVEASHIHLLIDANYVAAGEGIPNDETHRHFEDGDSGMELSLTPGSHILRLQVADENHIALEGDHYRHAIIVNAVDGAPERAVRIVSPSSGATVPPTFSVVMAASGLTVEPAGAVNADAGHFHLLIDEPFVAAGRIIPTNETHLHFGLAQLSTELTPEPGSYLLRLQMADGTHHALAGDEYRAEIQIIVDENAPAEQVMFIKPGNGATVSSPFLLAWAASGLIIENAGASIRPEGGHLHVLINEEFVEGGEAIPTDETHLHFGRGQTSTELTLEPGEYTLRLQMANGAHLAQDGAQYQDEITVTVR